MNSSKELCEFTGNKRIRQVQEPAHLQGIDEYALNTALNQYDQEKVKWVVYGGEQ